MSWITRARLQMGGYIVVIAMAAFSVAAIDRHGRNQIDHKVVHLTQVVGRLEYIPGPRGARGPEGRPGKRGARGPRGRTGNTGPQGRTGSTGLPGARGPQGPKGDKGDHGLQGLAGVPGPVGPVPSQQQIQDAICAVTSLC